MNKITLVCISALALMILVAVIGYYITNFVIKAIVLLPIIFGGIYIIRNTIVKK